MDTPGTIMQTCTSCGAQHGVAFQPSVNVTRTPSLREKIASGEYFIWECPRCGAKNLIRQPFLMHDEKERLMILLTDARVKSEGLPEGYTGRIVRSAGDLVEKLNQFFVDSYADGTMTALAETYGIQAALIPQE